VRVRAAETQVDAVHQSMSWPRRFAIAATLAAGVTGVLLLQPGETSVPVATPLVIHRVTAPVTAAKLTTRPVVETYESEQATIVEVPGEGAADDVKIVMIFDENLPADL
jgi:hypothetical protein